MVTSANMQIGIQREALLKQAHRRPSLSEGLIAESVLKRSAKAVRNDVPGVFVAITGILPVPNQDSSLIFRLGNHALQSVITVNEMAAPNRAANLCQTLDLLAVRWRPFHLAEQFLDRVSRSDAALYEGTRLCQGG